MSGSVERKEALQDFRAWNEAMVEAYDPEAYHLRSNPTIRLFERMRVREVVKTIEGKPGGIVLEVGCGAGNVLERVTNARLIGIDLSDRMVKRTKERLAGRAVSVLQANAEQLPFRDEIFDGIICNEVLEHVQNPHLLLDEIYRVARLNAKVAFSIPNEKTINRLKNIIFRLRLDPFFFGGGYTVSRRMDDEWHLHVFDLDELSQKLSKRFHIQKVTPLPSRFLPIRHVIACIPRK